VPIVGQHFVKEVPASDNVRFEPFSSDINSLQEKSGHHEMAKMGSVEEAQWIEVSRRHGEGTSVVFTSQCLALQPRPLDISRKDIHLQLLSLVHR
jgi:hypothetical protein